jgi:hypothetical protein
LHIHIVYIYTAGDAVRPLNELRCVDRVGYDAIDCWFNAARLYYYDVDGRMNGVPSIDR